jgi:hypothetical protein
MLIACLGWGSLTWKADDLPLASEWFTDGPLLPIEFSRVGDGGELATALCINAPPCKVLWAVLDAQSVEAACESLRQREQIPQDREDGVGVYITGNASLGVLAEWALPRQLDAVIWTALPPRVHGREGRTPTVDEAITYLNSLSGEALDHARDYIRQVPAQIDTPFRRQISHQPGWTA